MRNNYQDAGPNTRRTTPVESPATLTARQLEVLELLCEGLQNKQIARRLNIASATVKIHVANILRTLEVSSRLQAAIAAINLGVGQRLASAQPGGSKTIAHPSDAAILHLVVNQDQPQSLHPAHRDWSLEAAAG